MELSDKLKQARLNKGITQLELAARLGIEQSEVSKAETGKYVSPRTLSVIQQHLNIGELVTEGFKIVHTDNERYAIDLAISFVAGGFFTYLLVYLTYLRHLS